jgi:hypothetical protein
MLNGPEHSNNTRPESPPDPASANAAKPDYDVGYKKPPKKSQFKSGRSGNPKGRKKKEKVDDFRVLTERILGETVTVPDGKRHRKITRLESIILAHKKNGLKGDPKAIRTLMTLARKTGQFTKAKPESFIKITEPTGEKGRILRAFEREQAALAGSPSGKP